MLKHLPNFLSLLRLAAAPFTAWLVMAGHDVAGLLLFVLAALSDGLDGFIARHWRLTSRFGAWLDPAADKLLMLLCFLVLLYVGVAPWWLVALVLLRDLCIVGGVALARMLATPLTVRPSLPGKISTVVQAGYVGLCLLLRAFDLEAPRLLFAAAGVTAAFTLLSGLGYGATLIRAMTARHHPA